MYKIFKCVYLKKTNFKFIYINVAPCFKYGERLQVTYYVFLLNLSDIIYTFELYIWCSKKRCKCKLNTFYRRPIALNCLSMTV